MARAGARRGSGASGSYAGARPRPRVAAQRSQSFASSSSTSSIARSDSSRRQAAQRGAERGWGHRFARPGALSERPPLLPRRGRGAAPPRRRGRGGSASRRRALPEACGAANARLIAHARLYLWSDRAESIRGRSRGSHLFPLPPSPHRPTPHRGAAAEASGPHWLGRGRRRTAPSLTLFPPRGALQRAWQKDAETRAFGRACEAPCVSWGFAPRAKSPTQRAGGGPFGCSGGPRRQRSGGTLAWPRSRCC